MRLLLTGSTGFVGRNLLLDVLRRGEYEQIILPVRNLEKLRAQLLGDGFEQIPTCIRAVEQAMDAWDFESFGKIDHVVHSAGVLFADNESEYRRVNVEGTLRLISKLGNADKIVILSSMAASGPCANNQSVRSESDLPDPINAYGRSKLEMENELRKQFSHLPYVCLRPPMVLGPRDQATLPLFKMARFWLAPKPGLNPKVYSYISVADLVGSIQAVLSSPLDLRRTSQKEYFVACPRKISDRELIQTAAQSLNRSILLIPIPETLIEMVSRLCSKIPYLKDVIPDSLHPHRVSEILPDRWVCSGDAFETQFHHHCLESLSKSLDEACLWYQKTGQLKA